MRSPLTFARDALRARWGQPGTTGVSIAQAVEAEAVEFAVGPARIVDAVSLQAAAGKVTCLLGPSGSGKTTLLRLLAGLERPTGGAVRIDGAVVADANRSVPAEERGVGVVFQDYALFPHLSVSDNVLFGLRGFAPADARRRAGALLERIGLADRADAHSHELSGGEQQRVALARALAPRPGILLMDEPFSGLDARLRDEMREETLAILRETRATSVIVTHDPEEALRMGDAIALLRNGALVQAGQARDLYDRPVSAFAAAFFGEINSLPAVVRAGVAQTPLGAFATDLPDGAGAEVVVRVNGFRLAGEGEGFAARILSEAFTGDFHHLRLGVAGMDAPLRARLPVEVVEGAAGVVSPGTTLRFAIVERGRFVFPATDQP